jgi:hypothetical protein
MSIRQSTSIWGKEDGKLLEEILSEVEDGSTLPRIEEALGLLARALNAEVEGVVALEPSDPVLTDAIRCILCQQWLLPSVQRTDATGKNVASFFMQPLGSGQVISMFSSTASFEMMREAACQAGLHLTPVPLTFAQVVMAHLPNLSREALSQRDVPESNAVVAVSLDPLRLQEVAVEQGLDPDDNVVLFSETSFGMLQSFCHCFHLAGQVLQLQEDVTDPPATGVKAEQWEEVLCRQSLHAIEASQNSEATPIFASENGAMLFCYPGDAQKVLLHHQRIGTPGLDVGKVMTLEPSKVIRLIHLQANENKSTVIAATVMAAQGELHVHGLQITPEVFSKSVEPSLTQNPN